MSLTLHEAWSRTVRAGPDAIALIDAETGRRWSRREIDDEAETWRRAHGDAITGRTVAFGERNGVAWLRVFIGLLKADAVAVPFDPGEPVGARMATAAAAGADWLDQDDALVAVAPHRRHRDGRRVVKLTSGSTGTPKPLRFTDAQILADGHSVVTAMGITGDDLNLGLIPWGHSYGLGNLIVPLLTQGTAIISGIAPLPHSIAEATARWQPTVFPAVPALLRALVDSTMAARDLASLRTVVTAGAPIPPEVAQAFHAKFARRVHSFYGSSETGGIAFDATGELAASGGGVGRPMPGVAVTFERGQRLRVAGPAVFTIGNRRPGTHLLADIAREDEHGGLVLLGRAGRFVKIAGRRLNLAEVEHALRGLPGVQDAWVTPHAQRSDALAGAIAVGTEAAPSTSPGAIREALRARLASWKIPKKLIVLPVFPLTARGKTDSRALRARLTP
ncbi:class I adenylate-forming enzyme family protein [Synoicihabitans lomoniglobus]|uniref:Class I adenylate-forming enzyme family protein n=1 Tax=Synoicihabitans lomoniglobus TaxID=2909285 RepID=A0AAF0A0T3_9BACT|nr:acyl--CoA ligase [Opitutaceae bacterium LMO-M01]WED64462.1 class I adenylate-forming enzyme family protein [Opitutaceae bacterium LMO-M01]